VKAPVENKKASHKCEAFFRDFCLRPAGTKII
jgi:hypothetical protein